MAIERTHYPDLETQDEHAVAALTKSLTRSECHADIAATLTRSCKDTERDARNGLSELQKRGIAISFTLCSLLSASQRIPFECDAWRPRSDPNNGNPSESPSLDTEQSLCLGPQEWSAYNVYLSDATQLCHFLESRRRTELTHQQYLRTTKESSEVLRLIKERERTQKLRDDEWQSSLQRQADYVRQSSDFMIYAQKKIKDDLEESVGLRDDFQATLKRLETERALVWERVEMDMKHRLLDADSRFEAIVFDSKDAWKADMNRFIIEQYDHSVQDRVEQVELAVFEWGKRAAQQYSSVFASTSDHIELGIVSQGFERLRFSLKSSMDISYNISLAQIDLVESISKVTDQADYLLGKQLHLEGSLNRSARIIERQVRESGQWRPFGALSLFSGSAAVSIPLLGNSSGRVFISVLQLLGQLTYSMISAFVFLFILLRAGFRKSLIKWSSQFHPAPMDEEGAINTVAPIMKSRVIHSQTNLASADRPFVPRRPDRRLERSVSEPI
ncbi:uncharacterized protein I303_102265 [Kwoniella dejecticola CBS 10117]|uniref:Karyogamy protein n=1 Tax=Kwoniella dejecticola CBS 10117 TaxID=1296121 RepID=A0A1A6ABG4_9TREE|nr:uncharacterized protein I303_01595 [Kwoniella dejecticola CBS 10117]OBR87393.1 hypothetical protein I303_01595 [Kwoniella dejecticola CBS 10117]